MLEEKLSLGIGFFKASALYGFLVSGEILKVEKLTMLVLAVTQSDMTWKPYMAAWFICRRIMYFYQPDVCEGRRLG